MTLTFTKRIGALLVGAVLATSGCGGSDGDDNGGGGGGGGGPTGFHARVVLPEALRNGGPAGFNTTVSGIELVATLDGVPVSPNSVQWSITDAYGLWDPPADVTPSPATGATTSFQIPDFETVRTGANAWLNDLYGTLGSEHEFAYIQAPERVQLLSFGKQQVQAMSFKVVARVTYGAYTATASALVSPVTVSNGVNTQPLGMMVVANAPSTATYDWTLTYLPTNADEGDQFGAPPEGVTLQGADTKNPYLVPTVTGVYRLKNGNLTPTDVGYMPPLLFRVSTYHGSGFSDTDEGTDGISCSDCHGGPYALTDKFTEWAASPHANHEGSGQTLFELGLTGKLGPNYSEAAIASHVVGYSKVPTAQNRGFDDVMGGWTFPTPAAGNWAALPQALKYRAGVQCESCHGPLEPTDHSMVDAIGHGPVQPASSMDSGVCMSCHDTMEHDQGPLWATTGHANTALSILDATVQYRGTNAAHCGRCHAGEGFAVYVRQQQAGTPTNIARPTTCREGTPDCVCTTPGNPATCAPRAAATCTPRAGFLGASDPFDPLCPCKPSAGATTCTGDVAYYNYLASLGLTDAKVHSISCQTCHEPHSGELRVNGDTMNTAALFRVQNAGAGALCIVCHNSRTNAVRQGTNLLANWTAPHTAAQGDVFAGRNAFFIDALPAGQAATALPLAGPHLGTTADSCVLCHVRNVPEDIRDDYLVSGSNHTFKATMEVCKSCHAPAEVAEFEEHKRTVHDEIVALQRAIEARILARINANGFDSAVRYDLATDGDLPLNGADPTIEPGRVASVELYETHGQPAVKVTLTGTPVVAFGTQLQNIRNYNTWTAAFPASATGTPLFVVNTGTTSAPVAGADQTLAKIIYNFFLVEGDGTEGVHNPAFVDAVITATMAQLPPLP
ncbi:MAG TPA: hypothetical protein VEB43_06355 [Anaeromyxobacter sp.]|nr:hypothetical protein [Anaeromyxobacter sp.]